MFCQKRTSTLPNTLFLIELSEFSGVTLILKGLSEFLEV